MIDYFAGGRNTDATQEKHVGDETQTKRARYKNEQGLIKS